MAGPIVYSPPNAEGWSTDSIENPPKRLEQLNAMMDHEDDAIGVLQLINAKQPGTGNVVPFSSADPTLGSISGLKPSRSSATAIRGFKSEVQFL